MKLFFAKFFSVFLVFLLLFTEFGAAVQFNEFKEKSSVVNDEIVLLQEPVDNSLVSQSSAGSFACNTKSLSPEEAQKLKQEILDKGLTIQEIKSDAPAEKEREKLARENIVLTDSEEKVAVKQALPNEELQPFEVGHLLNKRATGAFAFGLKLDDTLRVSRCADSLDPKNCPVNEGNRKLRNSGEGIKNDFGMVLKDFKEIFTGDKKVEGMTEEEIELLKTKAGVEDEDQFQYRTTFRLIGNPIANYFKADAFEARMITNCNDPSSCLLSSYSMFDKYFNAWFSAEMVISNFGPTLVGRMRKLLGWADRRGFGLKEILPDRVTKGVENLQNRWRELQFRSRLGGEYSPDSLLTKPSEIYGKIRIERAGTKIKKYDFQEFESKMYTADYASLSTGRYKSWVQDSWSKPDGFLNKISQDVDRRKLFYEVVNDYKNYLDTADTLRKIIRKEKLDPVEAYLKTQKLSFSSPKEQILEAIRNNPAAQQNLIDYGKGISAIITDIDSTIGMDMGEYLQSFHEFGLTKFAARISETGEYIHMPSNVRMFRENIENVFAPTGKFGGVGGSIKAKLETDAAGNLKLFKVSDGGRLVDTIPAADLELKVAQGKFAEYFAKLDNGEFVPINQQNLKTIQENVQGAVPIYQSHWEPVGELTPGLPGVLTPEDFSLRLSERIDPLLGKSASETGWLKNELLEKGFQNRRYASLLDKAFVQEQELIKSYFSLKGGLKWTFLPFGYWFAKKGATEERLSAYQLPDYWQRISFDYGTETIYDDATIDFFANEGSDQGDIFVQFLNLGLWKQVLDYASEQFNPVNNWYEKFLGKEYRTKVEDIALYVSGQKECSNCEVVIGSTNFETFEPSFLSEQALNSYILEATNESTLKTKGQALIVFARHMNLKGKSGQIEGEEINIAKGMKEKKTCGDKIASMNLLGIPIGKILPKDAKVGGVFAIGESMGYVLFMWSGITGSIVQQTMLLPQLQDCVDSMEGYFAHMELSPPKEEKPVEGKEALDTKNVSKMIADNANKLLENLKGDDKSLTKNSVEKMQSQINKLVDSAQDNDVVEALVKTTGKTTASLAGKRLFFVWLQPGSVLTPTEYSTKGKEEYIIDKDNKIISDHEKGILSLNNKPIITSADNVRLETINTAIPAKEIPNSLTFLQLSDSTETLFEMNAKGELLISNQNILDCFKSGVKEQTGLELNSNNLSEAFGMVETIISDTHPMIKPLGTKIIAEGYPRRETLGTNGKAIIKQNREIELSPSSGTDGFVGKLKSIQLKNGVIIWKPSTNELVIWLKHHEKGILNQDDVQGLKIKKTETENALTKCKEPAFELEAMPDPNSDLSKAKVSAFNQSLNSLGPFQTFETDTRTFIFYSKLEDGKCKDYFKVINKKTGQVETDSPITSLTQEGNTLKVQTADGKNHELAFGAENGVPTLTYNGQTETLRTAQGKKGAFYYDPNTGLWYTDNAQLIPLIDAIKQKGLMTQANPDGTVSSKAGENFMIISPPSQSPGLLALPSLPENPFILIIFIMGIIGTILIIRFTITRKNSRG